MPMKNKLQEYFPIIRTRQEILSIIRKNAKLNRVFNRWKDEYQKEFLDFCCGARGIKVLYDSFFKEVFNPEYSPERLNQLLSTLLGIKVRILKILPLDTTRMGDETSLVEMDIVVETEDGTIINVEVQKIGYLFPGQRCACYSSDLLLRQYKRIRDSHTDTTDKFSYKEILPVYTIVFFEKSPVYFLDFQDTYIHNFKQASDTGLEIELLQRYKFICLDIFKKVGHNINNELDAWLTFLSSDEPEEIICLIEKYPEFKPMYDTLYTMCLNIEGVMNMFSEELYILDKNTELLMVDEFSRTIEKQKEIIAKMDRTIAEKDSAIAEKDSALAEKDSAIAEKDSIISKLLNVCKENSIDIDSL